MSDKATCVSCSWQGNWADVGLFGGEHICPSCGKMDTLLDEDGVSSDDYEKQERIDVPRE